MSHEFQRADQEQVGIFSGIEGKLAEKWQNLSMDDQQSIADALVEVTGDGPGICQFVQEDDIPLFVEHLRNYMSVEGADTTGLKEDAKNAINRILSKTDSV